MKRIYLIAVALVLFSILGCAAPAEAPPAKPPGPTPKTAMTIKLPEPRTNSDFSLEQTLLERRSVRDYADAPLKLEEVSQLLWAAQGVTSGWGGRTAPSAGGLYPLELYVVVGKVEGLTEGIYKYRPDGHGLAKVADGDQRSKLAEAALGQEWVEEAAIDIVMTAVYKRTTLKYGERGIRYVHMEAGHAAQNLYLQAAALGLGMVSIGAFYDDQVSEILGLPGDETPLYVIPVGRKK